MRTLADIEVIWKDSSDLARTLSGWSPEGFVVAASAAVEKYCKQT
jgi:hypothetical protein